MKTPNEKYLGDPQYRTLVDHLQCLLSQCQFTPSELREAVIYAATRYELTVAKHFLSPGQMAMMSESEEEIIKSQPRHFGKRFAQFCSFIEMVKIGQEPLLVGSDFVVMSQSKFEELSASRKLLLDVLQNMPTGTQSKLRIGENDYACKKLKCTIEDIKLHNSHSDGYDEGFKAAVDVYKSWRDKNLKEIN